MRRKDAVIAVIAIVALAVVAVSALFVATNARRQLTSERRAAVELRRRSAQRDPTTGLPNRAAIHGALRQGEHTSPAMILRLDGLDEVAAALGHDQVDAVVLRTAERLRAALGEADLMGRLDNGDFMIVPADAGTDLTGLEARLVGAVSAPQQLGDMEVVVPARVLGPDEPDRESSLRTLRLANDLRRAVPGRELEVYYQPIVDLGEGRICGAEALIRWNHPREGVLTPDRWLAIAEQTGLLPEIGTSTLEEVCRLFSTLNKSRPHRPLAITVNLATTELRVPGFVTAVADLLERSHLSPPLLMVEVDGTSLDDPRARAALAGLRSLGVRVSVDDLGPGLAALGDADAPIDQLKVPATLVEALGHHGDATVVTHSIVGLCAGLGVAVTAESVTTESQVSVLRSLGCNHAQGWHFGRALPYSRFAALIERMDHDAADPADDTASDSGTASTRAGGEPAGAFDGLT